jgi:ABC-type transport system substrate-binding protein
VGIEVATNGVTQDTLIFDALGGAYDIALWRQLGAVDPDGDFVWWDKENAEPIGQSSLNFTRIQNDDLNAAMQAARETTVFEERKAAYDEAQLILNQEIPYIWLTRTLWVIGAGTTVRNIAYASLPDGSEGLGFGTGFAGAFRLTDVWIEES